MTAALRAVQDEAGSKLPVLGYTVPYAIGNILLTAWGPVIVMLIAVGTAREPRPSHFSASSASLAFPSSASWRLPTLGYSRSREARASPRLPRRPRG